jgi:hypothetical protein
MYEGQWCNKAPRDLVAPAAASSLADMLTTLLAHMVPSLS